MAKKATARRTTCLNIINWLRTNPQELAGICAQFGLTRRDFFVLRYSQEWREAEASLSLVVARPVREQIVQPGGTYRWAYRYEATEVVAEHNTYRGVLADLHDASTRLNRMLARNSILESNETHDPTKVLLRVINNSNLTLVHGLERNLEVMEDIAELIDPTP